jgi:glycosyltransferase involved in cell wall biosynthesis
MKPHSIRHVTDIGGVPDYTVTDFRPRTHIHALVIPVLNENGRITQQLEAIAAVKPAVDVILADGGSTDGSTDLESLNARGVTTLLTKTGPGKLSAQLRMAIHFCVETAYDAVITMDGNGKDGVDGIDTIASALHQGYDFVQGSRFVRGGVAKNTPPSRYVAIRLIHAPITSIGARHWYTDTTNGFRGHSRRLLTDPRVAPLRDVFDTYELLAYLPVRAARLGYRVTEAPVSRAYPKGEAKPTKIRGLSGHAGLLRILLNAAAGRYGPDVRTT